MSRENIARIMEARRAKSEALRSKRIYITGLCKPVGGGFTHVYTDDTVYTLTGDPCNWGAVKVGEITAYGVPLTREAFEAYKADATETGTFYIYPYEN